MKILCTYVVYFLSVQCLYFNYVSLWIFEGYYQELYIAHYGTQQKQKDHAIREIFTGCQLTFGHWGSMALHYTHMYWIY